MALVVRLNAEEVLERRVSGEAEQVAAGDVCCNALQPQLAQLQLGSGAHGVATASEDGTHDVDQVFR